MATMGCGRSLSLLWRSLHACLLFGVWFCHCAGSANVTLSQITLHKKFSWFTTPRIYFSCKRSNETLVMKAPVQSLDITYNMTGHEDWQPVTKLDPLECQECELYESTWLGKGHLTQWNICSDNFTMNNHGTFIHEEPGFVELNLSCPGCTQPSFHHHLVGDVSGKIMIPDEVAPFFWVAIGVASLGAILVIVGSLAYLRYEETGEEHEKQKFIEMSEEEMAIHDFDHPSRELESLQDDEHGTKIQVIQDRGEDDKI